MIIYISSIILIAYWLPIALSDDSNEERKRERRPLDWSDPPAEFLERSEFSKTHGGLRGGHGIGKGRGYIYIRIYISLSIYENGYHYVMRVPEAGAPRKLGDRWWDIA